MASSSMVSSSIAASPAVVAPQRALEDPLAHLPCSTILEYKKGQIIYNQDQPSTSIHLVIDGKVKVCRLADDGRQVVVDIYQPDEFFGESAFLGLAQRTELAVALENTKVMTWTTNEIEEITDALAFPFGDEVGADQWRRPAAVEAVAVAGGAEPRLECAALGLIERVHPVPDRPRRRLLHAVRRARRANPRRAEGDRQENGESHQTSRQHSERGCLLYQRLTLRGSRTKISSALVPFYQDNCTPPCSTPSNGSRWGSL